MKRVAILAGIICLTTMQPSRAINDVPLGNDCSLRAVTLSKDTVSILQGGYNKTVIIFANNYTCISCNVAVNDYLFGHNLNLQGVDIVIISRTGELSMSRRTSMERLKSYYPDVKRILFEAQHGADAFPPDNVVDGLFGKMKIIKTPAIAIVDNSNLTTAVIQYNDLFDNEFDGISVYARKILKGSLEHK